MYEALKAIDTKLIQIREKKEIAIEKKERKDVKRYSITEIALLKTRLAILENLDYEQSRLRSISK